MVKPVGEKTASSVKGNVNVQGGGGGRGGGGGVGGGGDGGSLQRFKMHLQSLMNDESQQSGGASMVSVGGCVVKARGSSPRVPISFSFHKFCSREHQK
jgi:hypothetical protein